MQLSQALLPVIPPALVETVTAFVEKHEPELAVNYQWEPKEDQLWQLLGIRLSGGNGFERNLDLKRQLSQLWIAQPSKRHNIADYYVRIWGGIKGNGAGKINCYADAVAAGAMLPFNGIASWSKVATAADPEAAAIFDARVAVSLNALQILAGQQAGWLFSLLASQNKMIKTVNPLLKLHARSRGWSVVGKHQAYDLYLRLLAQASRRLTGTLRLARAEMVLFANAVDLAEKVQPLLEN